MAPPVEFTHPVGVSAATYWVLRQASHSGPMLTRTLLTAATYWELRQASHTVRPLKPGGGAKLSAPIRRLAHANNHGLHAAHSHGLYATVWLRALSLIRCSPPHP